MKKELKDMTVEERQAFMEALLEELHDRGELAVVYLTIEEIQGNLYAWDAETNEFLGQGATRDALFERLSEQAAGNTMYRIKRDQGGDLLTGNGLTH